MQDSNGKKYIRVSEFLSPFSGLQHVDELVLDKAARRGTRVHSICEGIAKGIEPFEIESELEGYVESFKKWWKDDYEVLAIEKRFFCDELEITGQIDFLLKIDGKILMCDLKTSANVSKTWPVQGSAYAYLLKKAGYDVEGIQFIKLNRYGNAPRICDYEIDIDFFQYCLKVYKYFYVKGSQNETRTKKAAPAS